LKAFIQIQLVIVSLKKFYTSLFLLSRRQYCDSSILFSLITSLLCLQHIPSYGQQDSIPNNLRIAKEQCDFKAYYKQLDLYERFLVDSERFDELESYDSSYDFLPTTSEDSTIYRKQLMYHGFRLKQYTGNLTHALEFYLRAHKQLKDKNDLDNQYWYTENYIANIYARLNDYDSALFYSKKVENHIREIQDLGKLGRHLSSMGDLYIWKKDTIQALKHYEEGLELALSSNNTKAICGNAESLARFYLETNQLDKFLESYNLTKKYIYQLKNNKDQQNRISEFESLLGDYYVKKLRFGEAELQYLKAIEILKNVYKSSVVREVSKVYLELARLKFKIEDYENSNIYCNEGFRWLMPDYDGQGLPQKNQISTENTFASLLAIKSDLYLHIHEKPFLDSAFMAIDHALYSYNLVDRNLLSLSDSKITSIKFTKKLQSKAIDILYDLWLETKDEKYLTKAKQIFSESKSTILNEKKSRNRRLLSSDEATRIKIESFEEELLRSIYSRNIKGNNTDSLDNVIFQTITSLEGEFGSLIDTSVYNTSSDFIEYFAGDNYYYRIDNFSRSPFSRIAESDSLEASVLKCIEEISSPRSILDYSTTESLSNVLLPTVQNKSEIVLIPDGVLLKFPFEILISLTQSKLQDFRYQFSSTWATLDYNQPQSIICLTPKYTKTSESDFVQLPLLKYQDEELSIIRDLKFSKVNFVNSLTYNDLLKSSHEYDILHFSGHVISNDDNVFLVTSEGNHISSELITNSSLGHEIVILGACSTGLGKYVEGDGIRSLAHGFLSGGTKSIIYSLWDVNDKSSSDIIRGFYSYLSNGYEPFLALRKSKEDFIATATPITKHPYYWAGLVCASHPLTPPKPKIFYWLFASLIFGLFILIYNRRLEK